MRITKRSPRKYLDRFRENNNHNKATPVSGSSDPRYGPAIRKDLDASLGLDKRNSQIDAEFLDAIEGNARVHAPLRMDTETA